MTETLETHAVVDGHDHDARAGQPARVILRHAGRAEFPQAPIDPHHHRQPGRARIWTPDVQRQAVQAIARPPERGHTGGWYGLRRRTAKSSSIPHRSEEHT